MMEKMHHSVIFVHFILSQTWWIKSIPVAFSIGLFNFHMISAS